MKDRIQKIIDEENMTPSRFADEVGLNRPAVSHILNGRNNPGLEALQRIINRFPNINATWLITGKGDMHEKSDNNTVIKTPTLFDENPVFTADSQEKTEYAREISPKTSQNAVKSEDFQAFIPVKPTLVKVKKIAVFYSDNTYEEFIPAEKS
jgi:transcriptional regulator with XRE-family HTH domain